ncbi:hypothetical protein KXJ69_00715 [Aureisphaera sp. CAU 1614]|uniref:Uncharacterized protein n=1 Tax=Halomarinibacterium sedimenti TaxID=2857106 RepID=A0A9X1JUG1_9FLAO|nr:hypothetical protein [Halomarinibacterium sedimenti]MBW2936605.1 hypothetical protein [Halomarinibacterium sedimenti]
MKNNQGFGKLITVEDYWIKLCWEYDKLKKEPHNTFKAFNFVITAYHLLEWIAPKPLGAQNKEWPQIKQNIKHLKVCEQLANGAKHFEVDKSRHKLVKKLESYGYVEDGYVEAGYFEEQIIITLSDSTVLTILELAESLISDWKNELVNRDYQIKDTPNTHI